MEKPADGSVRVFLESLRPGQVCRGIVDSVTDFGIFVDLGGAVGVVTAANASWRRVAHLSEAAHEGQDVRVVVLAVDLERGQASVSLKELRRDPFLDFAASRLGCTLVGPVTKVAPVGVFVLLDGEFLGLLPTTGSGGTQNTAATGDRLTVEVTYINVADRQVILSLPADQPAPVHPRE